MPPKSKSYPSLPVIGILGGMGPQAGVDLAAKIISQTKATKDQDHLPTVLFSNPFIPDRSAFLLGNSDINPGHQMAAGVTQLEKAGASVVTVACNTAHSPIIFNHMLDELTNRNASVKVLNLIEETVASIKRSFPTATRVGILGTLGTYKFELYDKELIKHGLIPLRPESGERLNKAIYDPSTGIKACSAPVSDEAKNHVLISADQVIDQGADVVILGCTELPLAVTQATYRHIPLIDPALMMARALITRVAPDRLLP